MPVPTISARQERAVDQGAAGTCATCPKAPAPSRTLPPATYALHFFEFTDQPTARDVRSRQRPLTPQAYQPVIGTSTVYVFQRQGGRTKLIATLKGGGTYTVTVRPGEDSAEVYVLLSHCPLLQVRLDTYTSEDGLEALRRRAVRFTPDNGTAVRPLGGQAYDVVLPDWRRLAWDAHAREAAARNKLMQFVDQPERTRRRMLAELTLAVAVQYEKEDAKVWSWLLPGRGPAPGRAGGPQARPKGMEGKPWRRPESDLAEYDRSLAQLQTGVERAASAKYAWMAEDGYREMRWDTLTDAPQQRETVKAEAALITPASQSNAGKAYLEAYAKRTDAWYGRYLLKPLAHEAAATKSDPKAAEAFWAILMSVGVAMLADNGKTPDRASADRDVTKNVLGVADAPVKEVDKRKQAATNKAQTERFDRQRMASRATSDYFDAEQAARAARKEADATEVVVERVFLRAIEQHTGLEGVGVPWLIYDEAKGRMVSIGRIVEAPVLTTRGAASPAVEAAAVIAARQAEASNARLAVAAGAEHAANRRFFDATKLEAKFGRGAAVTTGMIAALGILNLAIALRDASKDSSTPVQVKKWGAVTDLLYASEYGLLAWQRSRVLSAPTAAQAAEGGGTVLKRLIFGVRVVGIVGAVLSIWSARLDYLKAKRRGDDRQAAAAIASGVGAFMFALSVGATMAEGTVIAGWLAFAATTWWTGIMLVVALAGAALAWYFTNPPIKDWLQECPWGIDRKLGKTDQQHLHDLLQLLCAPRLTARVYHAGEFGAPPRAPGGVCFTLTPPFFFPGETSLALRLDVNMRQVGGIGMVSESGAVPLSAEFPIASTRLTIDPASEESITRLDAGPVLEVLKGTGRLPTNIGVLMRKQDEMVTFDVFLPMTEALRNGSGSVWSGRRLYSAGGSAKVSLWTRSTDSWRRDIRLDEVQLASAAIGGIR